eukprot:PhF_6_TR23312/c0_g2_i4/m.32932
MFYETQSISMEELRWLWDIGAIKVLPPTYDPKRSKTIFPPTLIPDLQNGSLPLRVMRACSRRYEDILVSMSNIGEAGPPPKLSDSFYDKGNVEQNWTKALHIAYTALGVRIPLSDKALISAGDCGVMLRCVREMYVAGRALEAKYMPDGAASSPQPNVSVGPPKLATERRRLVGGLQKPQPLPHVKPAPSIPSTLQGIDKLRSHRTIAHEGSVQKPHQSTSNDSEGPKWSSETLDTLYNEILQQMRNLQNTLPRITHSSGSSGDDELEDYTMDDMQNIVNAQCFIRGFLVRKVKPIHEMRERHHLEKHRLQRLGLENEEHDVRQECVNTQVSEYSVLRMQYRRMRCLRFWVCFHTVRACVKMQFALKELMRRRALAWLQYKWSRMRMNVQIARRAVRRITRMQTAFRKGIDNSIVATKRSALYQRLDFEETCRTKWLLPMAFVSVIRAIKRMKILCNRTRLRNLRRRIRGLCHVIRGVWRMSVLRVYRRRCHIQAYVRGWDSNLCTVLRRRLHNHRTLLQSNCRAIVSQTAVRNTQEKYHRKRHVFYLLPLSQRLVLLCQGAVRRKLAWIELKKREERSQAERVVQIVYEELGDQGHLLTEKIATLQWMGRGRIERSRLHQEYMLKMLVVVETYARWRMSCRWMTQLFSVTRAQVSLRSIVSYRRVQGRVQRITSTMLRILGDTKLLRQVVTCQNVYRRCVARKAMRTRRQRVLEYIEATEKSHEEAEKKRIQKELAKTQTPAPDEPMWTF